ncbi:MAG: recombinase RecT [Bacteroidales bacterium]|nr:recombinase RecT [Candidatus Latescibacterota bacterium]
MVENKDNTSTEMTTRDKSFTSQLVSTGGTHIGKLLQKRHDIEYFIGQAVISLMGSEKEKEYNIARQHPHQLLKVIGQQAILGLQSSLGLCHIVAFGQTLQLMVDYKGYLEVAHRHPQIKQIIAKAVYEKDEIDIDSARKPPVAHRISLDDDRGKLRGAYAMVEYTNGGFDFRWCPESEILDIRDKYSKAWKAKGKSSVWGQRPSEMYVKTAVNLLWKILPKTDAMHQLYKFDNAASAEMPSDRTPEGETTENLSERMREESARQRGQTTEEPSAPANIEDAQFEETEPATEPPPEKPEKGKKGTTSSKKEKPATNPAAGKKNTFSAKHHQRLADLIEFFGNPKVVDARQTLDIMKFHIGDHTPEDVERIAQLLENGSTN